LVRSDVVVEGEAVRREDEVEQEVTNTRDHLGRLPRPPQLARNVGGTGTGIRGQDREEYVGEDQRAAETGHAIIVGTPAR
jgi:hypothetical protein